MHFGHSRFFQVLIVIPLLTLTFAASGAAAQKAAVVNGSVISEDDLDTYVDQLRQRLSQEKGEVKPEQVNRLKEKALQTLINRELLYQESQKQGVAVDQSEIENRIKRLKSRFPDETQFKSALEKNGISLASLKAHIAEGLAVQKLIDQKFGDLSISDKEAKNYYDEHPEAFTRPEQVKARHILIKVGPDADDEQKSEATQTLEEVKKKLAGGEKFSELAKEYSEGPSSDKGGDLGYFSHGQMAKPFEKTAFSLNKGEVSDIVETRFGYHLIKVTDKRPESLLPYEDVKGRLQSHLKDQKLKQHINGYIDQLKGDAEIERFLP